MGGQNKKPLGYTIVELMIVLAISGVMFTIATSFINGKQEKTSFSEGVNDMASNLQKVIGQVTDGQYSDIPVSCISVNGSQPTIQGNGPTQGQNPTCVYLGKFLHFDINSSPPNKYEIFTLAANRLNSSNIPATQYYSVMGQDAFPTPVVNPAAPAVDLTEQDTTSQDLDILGVYINGGAANAYGFGFMQSLGTLSQGSYASGNQSVNLVYAPSLGSQSETSVVTSNTLKNLQPANSATICLTDHTRSAVIDIGAANGNPLAVNVTIKNSANCS